MLFELALTTTGAAILFGVSLIGTPLVIVSEPAKAADCPTGQQTLDGGCAPPAQAHAVAPPEVVEQYKAYCAGEWTKRGVLNTEMFDYCVKEEREGHEQLVAIITKYADKPWTQPLVDYHAREWTQKGNRQDRMVAAKMKDETEAYEDIAYEVEQPSFNRARMLSCWAKYGIQFEMTEFCYKQEFEERAQATLRQSLTFDLAFPPPRS